MDDRVFYLALAAIVLAAAGLAVEAVVPGTVSGPFWGVPVGILTFLTTITALRRNGNGRS